MTTIPGKPNPPKEGSGRPRVGELLDLRVENLAHGGLGIARRNGYVVFVEGGLPGDRVQATVTKSKRDYAHARTLDLVEPSEDRLPWRCEHEGGTCPGSPWQPLGYERQLEYKQRQVEEALRRLGNLRDFELEPIIPAIEVWRYRNKLEYSFGEQQPSAGQPADGSATGSPAGQPADGSATGSPAGQPADGSATGSPADEADGAAGRGRLVLGFHARGEWARIEDAHDCALASEQNNAVRNLVRDWCRAEGLDVYDRRGGGLLRNLVVREGRRTGDLQIRLVTSEGDFDAAALGRTLAERFPDASLLLTQTSALAEVSRGETATVSGSEHLEEELAGLRFRISPDAFFQTNTEMAERLYRLAADYGGLDGGERVFDLFCGIGTLSLVFALRAAEVWAIDIEEEAIADAIENAQRNEVDNVHFFAGDARAAIPLLAERAPRPDVVVVDPPRAGLSKKVVRRIMETNPKRIVYVSCNPTTLAPNAAQMGEAGYRLVKVRPVDMFPHTPHIECVALLENTNR